MRTLLIVGLGTLVLPGNAAGEVCLGPTSEGFHHTTDCDPLTPLSHPNAIRGFSRVEDGGCVLESSCNWHSSPDYTWTISASSTDPDLRWSSLDESQAELYVWLNCSRVDGFALAAFDVEISAPDLRLLSIEALNGTINAGVGREIRLAVGGCPSAPFLAAKLIIAVDDPDSVEPESWARVKAMYR